MFYRKGGKTAARGGLVVTTVLAISLILPVFGSSQAGPPSRPNTQFLVGKGPETVAAPPLVEQQIDLVGVDQSIVAQSQSAVLASFKEDLDHSHEGRSHDVEFLPLAPTTSEPHAEQVDQLTNLEPVLATRSANTKPFTLVGITSPEPFAEGARVLVRVEEESGWTSWTPVDIQMDQPDGEEARNMRFGTEPLLTNLATSVEVRIDTPDGVEVTQPLMILLDSPTVKSDASIPDPDVDGSDSGPLSTVAASTISAPMPAIITRSEWGADESLRRSGPRFAPTIKAAFIHHTASKSNYSPEEAPAQMRNLYTYFTKGLRYSDMAYNFIVDRFGRLYEGRAGGMDQAVVGGHTAGFNDQTFGVSALGNFQTFKPNDPEMASMIDSVSSLLAWKLSMNHRDPNGQISLVSDSSSGTSQYEPGQSATALVVGTHGGIGATLCPGRHLEAQLPALRAAAGAADRRRLPRPYAAPYGAGRRGRTAAGLRTGRPAALADDLSADRDGA